MLLSPIEAPSPNHNSRDGVPVSLVVLHYTGMETGQAALDRLRDPEAKVSAHYVVEEDGRIFSLVPESERAWHAGLGGWGPIDDVNGASVGIEIVNPGHYWGYRPFPEGQIKSVKSLVAEIFERHSLSPIAAIGHSDLAPDRKEDPGELFPWAEFASAGLAIGPYTGDASGPCPEYEKALVLLTAIGYRFEPRRPAAAVLAFQRRFLPAAMGQGLDPLTRCAIAAIAAEFGA